MFKKLEYIKRLGVFKSFIWDQHVKDSQSNAVRFFKDINIIYGRNYSGKTTLSRIFRGLEIGRISDKYEDPDFKLILTNGNSIHLNQIESQNLEVRVFNQDFVEDNLKFFRDPNQEIESFAVFGEENARIEEDIRMLEDEIGEETSGAETGLYQDRNLHINQFQKAQQHHIQRARKLEAAEQDLVRNRRTGIKYNAPTFGNQNYNKNDLSYDIKIVLNEDYTPIGEEEKEELEQLLKVNALPEVHFTYIFSPQYNNLLNETEKHFKRYVSDTGKIKELIEDTLLSDWVKNGLKKHSPGDSCAFCGNELKEDRWQKLKDHFNEEYENFEKAIDNAINEIELEIAKIKPEVFSIIDKSVLYKKFQTKLDNLSINYTLTASNYRESLNSLIRLLKKKKKNPITNFEYLLPEDCSEPFQQELNKLVKLVEQNNQYTAELNDQRRDAQEKLRLRKVYDFTNLIGYEEEEEQIEILRKDAEDLEGKRIEIETTIKQKQKLILEKKALLKDEQKGAEKVNEFLASYLGNHLSLKAIENTGGVRFQVQRDGKKAYNLSEGECSLLAFCYFVARLSDTNTFGIKPIVWIDDPISSLDSNHVFLVYSLLKTQIVLHDQCQQLFVSTHNLDFLKYLKKLHGGNLNQKEYFVINRVDQDSYIKLMPKYLKDHYTEFNYLFEQIYKCHVITEVNDDNYTVFYNFGNNARKFLEIYLYYKYPDSSKDEIKLKRFFNQDDIPSVLIDRVNNEYSHLSGIFERGEKPVEVPEMKSVADLIIDRLKQDRDQYNALLGSIGIPNSLASS